jgi:glycosyltransferase involved in cell wall biosynthesis
MKRILISAYACNPKRGSEEAVGWNWVQTIARFNDVTVLVAAFHESDIRAVCDPNANPRFVFVPHRPWHYAPTPSWRRIENSIAKPIMNLAYALWQCQAFVVARELVAREKFDLVHQLTYVGFRFPGHLYKLGVPFVWGPIGGLENTAWGLLPAMGLRGAVYYAGRNLINSIQRRFLTSPHRAAQAAGAALIAATEGIARELQLLYAANSTVISEVVAPLELSPAMPQSRSSEEPLRIVWSGEHLPGKALNLLLHALALTPADTSLEVHILGDGPMRSRWQALAKELGVDRHCIWHGHMTRNKALETMASAHVLAITSLKDLTSTVLLEGLALGLPVVAPDHCGFSAVITNECGIKINALSAQKLCIELGEALSALAKDEAHRMRLAEGALARARDFSSDGLADKIQTVYKSAFSRRHARESDA